MQVTIHKDTVPDRVFEKIRHVREHFFIGVKGKVKPIKKAPRGAEIVPQEIRILGVMNRSVPFRLLGRKIPGIEQRLDIRAVDLRRPQAHAIFKIRHTVLQSIREFFVKEGYLEVQTPKIIASTTEGGAALFPLLYYDKEAFLAQSPQLYKEQLVGAFEKVFEIGPVFRAERFRTQRHLSEITSVDMEEAYVTYEDIMKVLETLTCHIVKRVSEQHQEELAAFEHQLIIPELPFKRYTYADVLQMLQNEGAEVNWGDDYSTIELQILEKSTPHFYFITDWPTISKPFYIKPIDEESEISESFDLMHGSLELASGGSRLNEKNVLVERLKEKGHDPELFKYHLQVFDYGLPPHAGFGLGLDRLMMILCKQENIREVVLYPRDQRRLTP